jgi:hypothetical protein
MGLLNGAGMVFISPLLFFFFLHGDFEEIEQPFVCSSLLMINLGPNCVYALDHTKIERMFVAPADAPGSHGRQSNSFCHNPLMHCSFLHPFL